MNVEFSQRFEKETDEISDSKLRERIRNIIVAAREASNTRQIPQLKKLKGFHNFYRIRTGDYRIGVQIKGGTVIFAAFGSRKDIYRNFP